MDMELLSLSDVVFERIAIFMEIVGIKSQFTLTTPLFHSGTRDGWSYSTIGPKMKSVW